MKHIPTYMFSIDFDEPMSFSTSSRLGMYAGMSLSTGNVVTTSRLKSSVTDEGTFSRMAFINAIYIVYEKINSRGLGVARDRRLGFAGALRPRLFAAAAGGCRHGGVGGFIICEKNISSRKFDEIIIGLRPCQEGWTA